MICFSPSGPRRKVTLSPSSAIDCVAGGRWRAATRAIRDPSLVNRSERKNTPVTLEPHDLQSREQQAPGSRCRPERARRSVAGASEDHDGVRRRVGETTLAHGGPEGLGDRDATRRVAAVPEVDARARAPAPHEDERPVIEARMHLVRPCGRHGCDAVLAARDQVECEQVLVAARGSRVDGVRPAGTSGCADRNVGRACEAPDARGRNRSQVKKTLVRARRRRDMLPRRYAPRRVTPDSQCSNAPQEGATTTGPELTLNRPVSSASRSPRSARLARPPRCRNAGRLRSSA